MKTPDRKLIIAALLALPVVGLWAQERAANNDAAQPTAAKTTVWQPNNDNREAYREIVELNIFLPDRAALAARQNPVKPPEEPIDEEPESPTEPVAVTPSDPDRAWVLVGMSVRGERCYAFIENRTTGENVRVAVPGEFARGTLSNGGVDGLTYTLTEDETEEARDIRIGYTFTGEAAPRAGSVARPAGPAAGSGATTTPESAGSDTPAAAPSGGGGGGDEGLSDLERRLRERRLRGE